MWDRQKVAFVYMLILVIAMELPQNYCYGTLMFRCMQLVSANNL